MNKNHAHLRNFVSVKPSRFAIVDTAKSDVYGSKTFEMASGDTAAEAIERLFLRFMLRNDFDKEMITIAQRRMSLSMRFIDGIESTLIESNLFLIAL